MPFLRRLGTNVWKESMQLSAVLGQEKDSQNKDI